MKNISAYLWGYKNYKAGQKSIETFRKFYKESDAFVRIDTDGDMKNYKESLSKFNINIEYQKNKIGYPGKFSQSNHDPGRDHWPFENVKTWLESIYNCCKQTNSKYMIILEEDVFLMKYVSIIEKDFGIAIVKNRNNFPTIIKNFIKNLGGNTNTIGYGGCGGTIINTQIFIKGYEIAIKPLEEQFEQISKSTKLIGWSDMIIQVIIMCAGGNVVVNDQLVEPWMEEKKWIVDNWRNYEIVNYLKNIDELD